ncbi:hypothetical protein [Romboutsia weinsteinii]|uniref:hypothetical protein n=1 Tax=Romboutsia weinsteinii TaxID=2020949 RepID=UPI001314D800|nr:hypothetical protein [Romboutsia weinsteinii]
MSNRKKHKKRKPSNSRLKLALLITIGAILHNLINLLIKILEVIEKLVEKLL